MTEINENLNRKNTSLDVMDMVSNIVAAYVSNHEVEASELPGLIKQIQSSLCQMSSRVSLLSPPTHPAVPIEESIKPDYLVCLEDGTRMRMMKRHLRTKYNITPDEYRDRWNLPANYPMTAPNYTKKRQSIAKSIGLGKNRKKVA